MVLNIAHRGARSLAPENTLPAIRKAWEVGADVLEIDVAPTMDGRLIILHDDLLLRTTDVRRRFPHRSRKPCTTFTLADIRSLDAGSWFAAADPFGQIAAGEVLPAELQSFAGVTIPTLEEVLLFAKEKSWRVNIEIKPVPFPMETFPITTAVLQCVEQLCVSADLVIISSFERAYIREVRDKRPDIEINALIGPSITGRQDWGGYEFSTYNADAHYTDEAQIQAAHEHGCRVSLYTVNRPSEMLRFVRAGVRGLFTDFPQTLARVLKQQHFT
jgi:glycerophosphoryl diester phosphodiesterase